MWETDTEQIQLAFREAFRDSRKYGDQIVVIGRNPVKNALKRNIIENWLEYDGEVPLMAFCYKENLEWGFLITNYRIAWRYGSDFHSVGIDDIRSAEIGRSMLARIMRITDVSGKQHPMIYLTGIRNEEAFVEAFDRFVQLCHPTAEEETAGWPSYEEEEEASQTYRAPSPAQPSAPHPSAAQRPRVDPEVAEIVRRYYDKLSFAVKTEADAVELMDTIRQIPGLQFKKCVYFLGGGDKSSRKLAGAAKSYGIGRGEFPLVCFDNTAFGGAEDGCLLTTQAVCIHNVMEDVVRLPYERVNDVEAKGFIKKDIYVNGYKIDTNLMDSGDVEPFARLIQALTEKFTDPDFNVVRNEAPRSSAPASYDAGSIQKYLQDLRFSARKFDFRKSLYYWDNTEKSNKKIMGAIQSYARIASGELPLVCFDNTVFGTADVGALITTRGVYLKNQMKTEQFFSFDLMVIAELRGAFIKDVYINDMKLDTTCMDDDDKEGFVEFINLMAKQFGRR